MDTTDGVQSFKQDETLISLISKYPALGFGFDPVSYPVCHCIVLDAKERCQMHYLINGKLSGIKHLSTEGVKGYFHLDGYSCLCHDGEYLIKFFNSSTFKAVFDGVQPVGSFLVPGFYSDIVGDLLFHVMVG